MIENRPIPCSLYDFEGMQRWLDEMALQGLFFQGFTKRNDRARFLADTPRPVRYRLDPVGKSKTEDQKRKEPYAQMGWEFVDALPRMYSVFSCGDPEAPELHSDPGTLAYALNNTIQKQIKYQSAWALGGAFFLSLMLFLVRKPLWEEILLMEEPRSVFQLGFSGLVFLFCVIAPILQIRMLVKTRRALELGLTPQAGRRWNRPRQQVVYWCVIVPILFVDLFATPSYRPEVCGLDERELSHPWPTLAQMEATGPRPLAREEILEGYLQFNHSWLVPVQEYASITWENSTFDPDTGEVTYTQRPYTLWQSIRYDQARSPWAARQVYQIRLDREAEELEDALTYPHTFQVTDLQDFQQQDYPGLDRLETVHFRRADQDAWLFAALRGREVLVVEYVGYAQLEDCLPLFLEALDQPAKGG